MVTLTASGLKGATPDRWMRLTIWIVLANCLHFLVLTLLPLGLAEGQAIDAIRRIQESGRGPWGFALLAPSMLATLTIAVSSSLLGMAMHERMLGVTGGVIAARRIQVCCQRIVPSVLVFGVALIASSDATRGLELSRLEHVLFFAVIASPAVICWLVTLQRLVRAANLLRFALAGVLTICLVLIVATALIASWALAVGPVGLLLIGVTFWAVLFTHLLISIPLFINWLPVSTAWILLLAGATVGFHSQNPYRMPSVDAPVELAGALAQRRYPNPEHALYAWLEARLPENDDGGSIPIFLVSANGGGIRTGYWAARSLAVLDRMTKGAFSRHTFAYSSVSGGGLGIAAFIDSSRRHGDDPGAVIAEIDAYFSRDLLSPVLGRMLIGDPLRFWWGLQSIRSRDEVFEDHLHQSWQAASGSSFFARSMLDVLGTSADQKFPPPLVSFNATIVDTGARLQIANYSEPKALTRARGYFDGMDNVEVHSLSIAQAVHLSARFPGVSPPASLQARQCVRDRAGAPSAKCHWERRHWVTVVDGGYNDNSGLAPIISIYDGLTRLRERAEKPCVPKDESDQERCTIENKRKQLLKRLQFQVVILDGNTIYVRDEQGRAYPRLDPFLHIDIEERAPKPMLDIGAMTEALDNTRAGREYDSWATIAILMNRVPRGEFGAARDSNYTFGIDRSVDEKLENANEEIKAACEPVADENIKALLADVPLGWSLSARVSQSMQCATERAMFQRVRLYRNLTPRLRLKGPD